ncbi:hypothetical protein FDI40_gp375 [Agrobacterium phage Atu_ph07]|uniref:Uncharacterized protein n=1 Tax=Agrobacterium phage Atu_ph07 TaxID=2024264 RepID=A0A2L0V014_9CAUD|nr:hypothetical protein FDI40_gp375 [Agrobacterium phage Atu_ph07]AUZ95134.1 hypothetical protein [Agrobacterium phage Atu_ph07]
MYREEVPVGAFTMVFLSFLIVYPEIKSVFYDEHFTTLFLLGYNAIGVVVFVYITNTDKKLRSLENSLMAMFLWPYEIVKRMLSKNV